MAKKKKYPQSELLRITDSGALSAVQLTDNVLIYLHAMALNGLVDEDTSLKDLVGVLKGQQVSYLSWLQRTTDMTAYASVTKGQLTRLVKASKEVLGWDIIPSKKEIERRHRLFADAQEEEIAAGERIVEPIRLMLDTSCFLAYAMKNEQHQSLQVLISYLKTQKGYYNLVMPSIVGLEIISQLVKTFSFNRAMKMFDDLILEVGDGVLITRNDNFGIIDFKNKYQKFSRRSLSKKLRGMDFVIATEGIESGSVILTCDRAMYLETKKFYKDIFFIDKSSDSYTKFVVQFEKMKASMMRRAGL